MDGSQSAASPDRVRTWPRRYPRNVVAAWARAGASGGLLIGGLVCLLIIASTLYSLGLTIYSAGLILLAVVASVVTSAVCGSLLGTLNGAVLAVASHTAVLRSPGGVSPGRTAVVTAVVIGLGAFAVLRVLFGPQPLIVYPFPVAGAAVAIWMSRRLPPVVPGG